MSFREKAKPSPQEQAVCARCGDPAEINSWDNVAQIWGYDMCPRCSGEWRQAAPLPTSFPDVRKGYAEFTAQWVKAGRT